MFQKNVKYFEEYYVYNLLSSNSAFFCHLSISIFISTFLEQEYHVRIVTAVAASVVMVPPTPEDLQEFPGLEEALKKSMGF